MLQTLKAVIFCYKTSLGLQKHYRLNAVKEAIIYELKYNLGSEYNEGNILGGLFKARFPKDKADVEGAAFKQLEQERKEGLQNLQKRTLENSGHAATDNPAQKKGNFRPGAPPAAAPPPTRKNVACRNWNAGFCNKGDSCRFGHFPDPSFRPTGGNAQPMHSQAASYTSGVSGSQPAGHR